MAGVATATGLGIGGIAAIGGLALSAIGMGASFGQASKQRKAEEAAKRQAEKAMAEARKKLERYIASKRAINSQPLNR